MSCGFYIYVTIFLISILLHIERILSTLFL